MRKSKFTRILFVVVAFAVAGSAAAADALQVRGARAIATVRGKAWRRRIGRSRAGRPQAEKRVAHLNLSVVDARTAQAGHHD